MSRVTALGRARTRTRVIDESPFDSASSLSPIAALGGVLILTVDCLGRVSGGHGRLPAPLDGRIEDLVGLPMPAALADLREIEEALRAALGGDDDRRRCTVGDTTLDVHAAPQRDADGMIDGAVALATPSPSGDRGTRSSMAAAPLSAPEEADLDLPGRSVLERAIRTAVQGAKLGSAAALLHLRVTDLRLVNRALGREAGDELLRDSVARLREAFPHPATLCRVGAADFGVVLTHLAGDGAAAAQAAADGAVELLESTVEIGGTEVRRGARAGIALAYTSLETPEVLLQAAEDQARSGSIRRPVDPLDGDRRGEARMRLRLLGRLDHAAERDELRLYYQPLYALAEDRPYGVEALLRWYDPEQGFVSPAEFIPLAEAGGAMFGLGQWVIEELCRHAEDWSLDGRRFQLHFNASAMELQVNDYPDQVLRRIARHGLEPDRFTLELTESTVVMDSRRIIAALERLRAAGMRVAIDDFGAGQSSLTRLKDLPADVLKIDRGIVKDIPLTKHACTIFSAAVSMAENLGMETVAEGIETPEQRDFVLASGCTYGQGFMLGRPEPRPSSGTSAV